MRQGAGACAGAVNDTRPTADTRNDRADGIFLETSVRTGDFAATAGPIRVMPVLHGHLRGHECHSGAMAGTRSTAIEAIVRTAVVSATTPDKPTVRAPFRTVRKVSS